MKAVVLIFILCFEFSWAQTDFKSIEVATSKLSSYSVKDLSKDQKNKSKKNLNIDQMFNDLKGGVSLALKQPFSVAFVKQLGRVAVLTFEHDPTNYAAEILLPLYQKDKNNFLKAIGSLPEEDQAVLLQTLQDSERELKQGNG